MRELHDAEILEVSGGITNGGIPARDPSSDEYMVVPYHGGNPPLYVNIGGRWVPTGTEPFIPPRL
jgi:hypothetical protein